MTAQTLSSSVKDPPPPAIVATRWISASVAAWSACREASLYRIW